MLVDTGLGLPDAKERWAEELARLDGPVVTVFLTHFHPDHLGAAADVGDLTGARIVQGRVDAAQAALVWQGDGWSDVLVDWFHLNGVPETVTEELIGQGSCTARSSVPSPIPSSSTTAGASTDGTSSPHRATPTAS